MGESQQAGDNGWERWAAGTPASGWFLSLYPEAAEAGGSFRYASRVDPSAAGAILSGLRRRPPGGLGARCGRYCAANRLNRFGTPTYEGAGCHDAREIRCHVAEFFRSLRKGLGGRPLPYVWTTEWHKTDHGLHVHFAVGQYVARSLINRPGAEASCT